jgi:tetratricopeptide (TPR) repeat protein
MKRRPAGLLLALLLGAALLHGQEPVSPADPVQRELQAAQDLLARATAEFDGAQQSRSIVLFDDVIGRLEGLHRQKALPARGREMLVQAYELRGRAYFNIGLQEKAAESFRSLIQLQPQYDLSPEKVSPKVVDYYASLKKALTGFLAVSTRPAGARVTLNGEFLSLTDFFPLEILAGDYTVEISRLGYQTEVRTLSVAPQATEAMELELKRTMASAFFVTEPAGVEIWVDGQLRDTTAGSLAPDLLDLARSKGLDPAKASARLEVPSLSVGTHVVELRKKCYEPQRRTVEATEPRDYDVEPVRLEESLGTLKLTSDPPGARILLDEVAMGVTPKELTGVCSGRHRIEVKHAAGRFIQDLVLEKGATIALDCPIRPSLSFLGVVSDTPAGDQAAAEAEERILQHLGGTRSLNFIPAPRETVDRLLEAEKLTRRSLVPGAGADPDLLRKVTEKLAAALEVQGFLVGTVPEERLRRSAVLHLLAAGNTVADQWTVNFAESASYLRFLAALEHKATLYRPWTGLVTVDTLLHQGVPVLRVVPGSPAAQAGVAPGEILESVDGRPAQKSADLLAALAERKPKDRLSLRLKGPAGSRAVDLAVGLTPQEIPLHEPSLLYNKVMMELRQQVEGYPGTEAAAFARLNLAICAMHFSDFAGAHEHLLKAKNELPQRPGVSQATALYYLGVALERLGYAKEAADAYRSAAGAKDATLFNNDGPAVSALAARRTGS